MKSSSDLFTDQGPEFVPQPARLEVVAGKVVATMGKPNATQKRFNDLMARIDAEQAQAAKLRHAFDVHGHAHRQAMHEIASQSSLLCKNMVLFLDGRIQAPAKPKGLTANQKRQAIHMLLALCEQIEPPYDTEIQAVLSRYGLSAEHDADQEAQDKQEAQDMLAAFLGEDFAQGREFDSPEAMMRAAMEFAQQKQQAQEEKREAKRAARQAKKGLSAREQAAAQKEMDAQSALRTVFRQLASALHPDREPDEALRKRKTEWMSEVNAAYERKDLSALLRIQLQSEMVDASKAAALSDAKLKAMCVLLAEQVKALEADNWHLRQMMEIDFGYPTSLRFDDAQLLSFMHMERSNLQEKIAQMQGDLQRVQDDKELKAWLKEQVRASKAAARFEEELATRFDMDMDMDAELDSMFDAMTRRR